MYVYIGLLKSMLYCLYLFTQVLQKIATFYASFNNNILCEFRLF